MIFVSRVIFLSGMLSMLLKGMVNMNDMHLVDDLSVYTFQTSQKKQIRLSCILFYNLSEVIIQITSKGLKWISKFDSTCEGNSLLIREPWFWNGAEQSLAISDCRASIDHPERFLLEPLMVKYFMWVLSLLTLAWCCNRAVSFPFFFFSFLFCCFYFLEMKWGNSGEEQRGCVWIFVFLYCLL